jgi:sulfur carrier protein ThiS
MAGNAGKISLIDVATTNFSKETNENMKVSELLDDAGLDLSKSVDVTVRVNFQIADLDTEVGPGDVVLVTRNIDGGAH